MLGVLTAAAIGAAQAQITGYPAKPVRLVVGFSAGGGTDTLARLLGKRLTENWTQPIVIENRAGADGSIAAELVAHAAPDGYALVMISNAHTITPFQRKLGYDPIQDFAPVTLVASTPNLLLVHPSLPVHDVRELVALAQKRPGQLTFASSGTGTSPFLAMELFKSMSGTAMVHVPYKGSAPAVVDLLGGHVQLMFGAISTTLAQVEARRLRAIAISAARRWPSLPVIPTVSESGLPGFEASTWYGVLAPGATPREIVNKLQSDIAAILREREVREYLAGIGFAPSGNRPEEFAELIRSDMKKWGPLLKRIGAVP
jgi:tripartite-type tricarboxylate transporter receptor subunit TctC